MSHITTMNFTKMLGLMLEGGSHTDSGSSTSRLKRTPPRSPRRLGGVCRKLTFGASNSPLRRQETRGVYEKEMGNIQEANQNKWNYDFLGELQLPGRYKYKVIATTPEKSKMSRNTPGKSPLRKVKKLRRSPTANKDVTVKCACGVRISARSCGDDGGAANGKLLDFKSELGNGVRSARCQSPMRRSVKSGVTCGPYNSTDRVRGSPMRRVRAAGVVRNLAALYWSDNNNNKNTTKSPMKSINNNNNIIKNCNIINSQPCSPLGTSRIQGSSENCENTTPGSARKGTPEMKSYKGTPQQPQITDFFGQQKALLRGCVLGHAGRGQYEQSVETSGVPAYTHPAPHPTSTTTWRPVVTDELVVCQPHRQGASSGRRPLHYYPSDC